MPAFAVMPSVLWGLGALAALWILIGLFGNTWSPLKLIQGADNRPSTSKFQWLVWTAVVYFAYVVAYATRARDGIYEPIAEIPTNVLYAMGLSVLTMTAAKGIKVGYINSNRVPDDKTTDPREQSPVRLLTDDSAIPDLSKIQMVAWTLLASTVYLIRTFQAVRLYATGDNDLSQLPDIDTTLMVLMGLGQGGYLGKKATTVETDDSKKKRTAAAPPREG